MGTSFCVLVGMKMFVNVFFRLKCHQGLTKKKKKLFVLHICFIVHTHIVVLFLFS